MPAPEDQCRETDQGCQADPGAPGQPPQGAESLPSGDREHQAAQPAADAGQRWDDQGRQADNRDHSRQRRDEYVRDDAAQADLRADRQQNRQRRDLRGDCGCNRTALQECHQAGGGRDRKHEADAVGQPRIDQEQNHDRHLQHVSRGAAPAYQPRRHGHSGHHCGPYHAGLGADHDHERDQYEATHDDPRFAPQTDPAAEPVHEEQQNRAVGA